MPKEVQVPRFVARRTFGYSRQELDVGQVITLAGAPNDEKLVRLGYLVELDPRAETHRCAECGQDFSTFGARDAHGSRRHRPRAAMDPLEEDAAAEREERVLDREAPLYLEKTLASQKG